MVIIRLEERPARQKPYAITLPVWQGGLYIYRYPYQDTNHPAQYTMLASIHAWVVCQHCYHLLSVMGALMCIM